MSKNKNNMEIYLKSIRFGDPAFRKLKNITINFTKRITLIAGHNAIGKSTILGLIANASGLTNIEPKADAIDASNPLLNKAYYDLSKKAFNPKFEELFHLSLENEYFEKDQLHLKPNFYVNYSYEGQELIKKCNVTKRDSKTLRIVPRTDSEFSGKKYPIGHDRKASIPTIYLGLSRLAPIGEFRAQNVMHEEATGISAEIQEYLQRIFGTVIVYEKNSDDTFIQALKNTNKYAIFPDFKFDTRAISSGQDSLGSIVTALASFKKVKSEMGNDYPGGILIIDEIDAGLHPSAQIKLLELLKQESKSLNIQIVATTHSLVAIKKIFDINQSQKNNPNPENSVVYIWDTVNPFISEEKPTFELIQKEMLLDFETQKTKKPIVNFIYEDDEAKYFLSKLMSLKRGIFKDIRSIAQIKHISLKEGCEVLNKIRKIFSHTKGYIFIFDGDYKNKLKSGDKNCLTLPEGAQATHQGLPPEAVIRNYIISLIESRRASEISFISRETVSTDRLNNLTELTKNDPNEKQRDTYKNWFKKNKSQIEKLQIMKMWCDDNELAITEFAKKLKQSIQVSIINES